VKKLSEKKFKIDPESEKAFRKFCEQSETEEKELTLGDLIEDIFRDLFEEEKECPAITKLKLYDEREILIKQRDSMSSFLLGNDDRQYYNVLCNQIIRLTEQIRNA